MNKFYILIIAADKSLKKMWADNNAVFEILKANQEWKVYRSSNDQEAVLVENDKILWQDVPTVEKI